MTRTFHHNDEVHPAYQRMTAFQINPMRGAQRIFVMTIQGNALNGGISPGEYFEPEESELADLRRIGPGRRHPATSYADYDAHQQINELEDQDSSDTFHVRPLRGLVVRDANGQFYESIGQRLRPLQRIARGPTGELLELIPVGGQPVAFEEQKKLQAMQQGEEPDAPSKVAPHTRATTQQKNSDTKQAPRPTFRGFRRLFGEPGIARIGTFGEFRSLLSPQCAHADRLRDSHRVKALVRVYEATCKQPIAAFFNDIQNEDPSPAPLQPLGEAMFAKLELANLLPAASRPLRPAHREPGIVLPYERFFRLVLSADPTTEKPAESDATEGTAPATVKNEAAPAKQNVLRTSVPEAYMNPWEFRITRDEALYDMNRDALAQSTFRKFGRWLKRRFSGQTGLQKWQALLNGKSLDDQLWAVRPPQKAFQVKAIKDWVRSALTLAGYEPQSMILEWEVFWRRKGV